MEVGGLGYFYQPMFWESKGWETQFWLPAELQPTKILVGSASPGISDRLVVNKDNASPGGLQASDQRISVF